MPRGRKTTLTIDLTVEETAALRQILRQHGRRSVGVHRRARIVLLRAAGLPITEIARQVALARRNVYKWLWRWEATGLAGLTDTRGQRRATRTARGASVQA
jgi:hypothetical protein